MIIQPLNPVIEDNITLMRNKAVKRLCNIYHDLLQNNINFINVSDYNFSDIYDYRNIADIQSKILSKEYVQTKPYINDFIDEENFINDFNISFENKLLVANETINYTQTPTAINNISSIYKNFRNYSIFTYLELKMKRFAIDTMLSYVKQTDTELVLISYHADSYPCCSPYQNKIFSLSSGNTKYDSLDSVIANGLFHINCRHYMTKVNNDTVFDIPFSKRDESESLALRKSYKYQERVTQQYLLEYNRLLAIRDFYKTRNETLYNEYDKLYNKKYALFLKWAKLLKNNKYAINDYLLDDVL